MFVDLSAQRGTFRPESDVFRLCEFVLVADVMLGAPLLLFPLVRFYNLSTKVGAFFAKLRDIQLRFSILSKRGHGKSIVKLDLDRINIYLTVV
jgi:hypothetical protein